ncbi:MFS transporter [Marinobacter salinexigens]|uniref:MFS transporter n=1 Tax=Marinobacter salinexigens TaxID=2919747 RepID=A0A5B0VKI2_9GAMM|nr:MFS transporter [Marinobacter salinexigens]KAA1174449.1 MFS transporter [Marinobacter salinexigens]
MSRDVRSSEDDARQSFIAVCVSLTFCFVVYSMLLVTVPVYGLELGASPLMLGVVLSSQYLLPLLLAIPLGGVVARMGGRVNLIAGGLVMVAGLMVVQLVPGYPGLIIGQLLVGLAHLQMVLSAQTVISSLGSGSKLENYFGWYSTWLSGGQVIGPLLAGAWIESFGGVGNLFLVMALIAQLGCVTAFWLTGEATRGIAVSRAQSGFRAQAALMRRNTGVQMSVAVTVAGMFALGVYGSYLPVYLHSLEVSAALIGVLVSLRAGVSMLIRPFIPRIIQAAGGREKATVLALAALALGLGGLGFAGGATVVILLSILVGIGGGLSQPLSMVVLAESVAREQRSGALGMRLMANRAIHFLAPLWFGALLELAGFGVSFALSGLVVAGIAYLLICLCRQ